MVSGRAWLIIAGTLATLLACRGEATHQNPSGGAGKAGAAQAGSDAEGGASDDAGGTSGRSAGAAGKPATAGGAAGSGAGAGTGGAGAGTGGAGGTGVGGMASGGAAGGSTRPDIPGVSAREREILAPLGTDDATLEATSGAALIELVQAISLARGYAMCRCVQTPDRPPPDVEQMLLGCAGSETGIDYLTRPDQARCVEEGSSRVPDFDAAIRCRARWLRDDGNAWANVCFTGVQPEPAPQTCMDPTELTLLVQECQYVTYCANDERVTGARCDQLIECPDQSDELGCFEELGRDWFWCDPDLVDPRNFCEVRIECGLAKEPPVCDRTRMDSYLCDDGGAVSTGVVCNRATDCDDGSDERYCFR
jgi:hypothetical protein